jgi:hypothetical protein
MSPRAVGALLAIVAALAFVVASASPAWWSGHPDVNGHTVAAKRVSVGLVGARGCNVGGDGRCEDIPTATGVRVLGYALVALVIVAIALAGALSVSIWRTNERRHSLANMTMILVGASVLVAIILLLAGPGLHTGAAVHVPIGWGPFVLVGAAGLAFAASMIARGLVPVAADASPPVAGAYGAAPYGTYGTNEASSGGQGYGAPAFGAAPPAFGYGASPFAAAPGYGGSVPTMPGYGAPVPAAHGHAPAFGNGAPPPAPAFGTHAGAASPPAPAFAYGPSAASADAPAYGHGAPGAPAFGASVPPAPGYGAPGAPAVGNVAAVPSLVGAPQAGARAASPAFGHTPPSPGPAAGPRLAPTNPSEFEHAYAAGAAVPSLVGTSQAGDGFSPPTYGGATAVPSLVAPTSGPGHDARRSTPPPPFSSGAAARGRPPTQSPVRGARRSPTQSPPPRASREPTPPPSLRSDFPQSPAGRERPASVAPPVGRERPASVAPPISNAGAGGRARSPNVAAPPVVRSTSAAPASAPRAGIIPPPADTSPARPSNINPFADDNDELTVAQPGAPTMSHAVPPPPATETTLAALRPQQPAMRDREAASSLKATELGMLDPRIVRDATSTSTSTRVSGADGQGDDTTIGAPPIVEARIVGRDDRHLSTREREIAHAATAEADSIASVTDVHDIPAEPSVIVSAPVRPAPPMDAQDAAGEPTPPCPQCDAPMSWVDEHLRFYCKQCRVYF